MTARAGAGPAAEDTERTNPPRSRKGAQTRARLLEAAERIFETNGFLDARISDIAARAGVSHGSFYHYFESKEEIFREVAAAVDEKLAESLEAVILDPASHAPPQERIRAALRLHFQTYRDHARMMGVIEQVSRYDAEVGTLIRTRHQHYARQIADSIRRLQRRGMADKRLDPTVTAAAIGALTDRFAESWLVQGTLTCTVEEAADQVAMVIANAMGLTEEA